MFILDIKLTEENIEEIKKEIENIKEEGIKIDDKESEVVSKHIFKRSSCISYFKIPSFENNRSQALYLTGSNNLIPNKLRYQLLTLSPVIYAHSKSEISNILKDKKSVLEGKISMYDEIISKYSSNSVYYYLIFYRTMKR